MPKVMDRIIRLVAARRPHLLGAALSLGFGTSLYLLTAGSVEQEVNERFTTLAYSTQSALNSRIKGYADVLRGATSLFQVKEVITRDEFHRYVEGLRLETEVPGIEAVNFARYIRDEERDEFEAAMQKELGLAKDGKPVFRITPPGRRPEYTVLTYIEPSRAWTQRFGLDLQARPTVALSLSEARDSGQLTTSGSRVVLKATASGLGMRMPVYRPGMPVQTVEQRRAAYIGSAGIGFGVEPLVQGTLDHLPPGMRLVITGLSPEEEFGGPRGTYRRVVFFDNMSGRRLSSEATYAVALPIGISQRGWTANFSIPKSLLRSDVDRYQPWAALLAGSLSSFMLYMLYHTLSSSRRRAVSLAAEMTLELRISEAKLQQTNERLRRMAAHAEHIKENERKRIAREIHDDLGQNLLALRIEADLLAARTAQSHPRLHARAIRTLGQIDQTIKSVRQIINDLRPNVLDLGLSAAVDWQIAEFRRHSGITCEIIQNKEVQINDQCATALFRILQESLTNIARHACASHICVHLTSHPDHISMSVTDNGTGIPSGGRQKVGSFGLAGIEERIMILGGSFTVGNAPGGGTRIEVSIPLDTPSPSPESSWQPGIADQSGLPVVV
jgi:signal transduction histidine kinase